MSPTGPRDHPNLPRRGDQAGEPAPADHSPHSAPTDQSPHSEPPGFDTDLFGPGDFSLPEPGDDRDFDRTREFDFGDSTARSRARRQARGGGGRGGRSAPGGRPPTPPRRPPAGPAARRPAWQRLAIVVGGAILLLLLATTAVRASHSGKALPGTEVAGEPVGGKTEDEIRDIVRSLGDPDRRITIEGPGKPMRVSAGGSGLQVNETATVDRALEARRGGLFGPLLTFVAPANVDLVATVNRDALRASVARVAEAVDRKPYAGALSIDPDTLVVTTKSSAAGRQVDRTELADRLERAVLRPDQETVEVPVDQTKAVSDKRVEEVGTDAEQYLRTPLKLTGAGKTFTVTPQSLAKLLTLEALDGGRKARLSADATEAKALAERVANARDRAARSATISAASRGPIVDGKADVTWRPRSADVKVTADGRTGVAVKVDDLSKRIVAAVRKKSHAAKVPTETTKAPVSRESAAKIDRIIGTFTTYYVAGQPRVTNIQRIARSIDRTVIGPGEQFSLNGISGERTKDKGYVEAPFIAGNKIEPSVGGGVSQFSTTMYNAAYFAGLQLDAYQAHSLFIDRYPAGRESTLNFPDIDMKWTNDTDAPIFIRTFSDSAGVTVTLYGNNGGRKVEAVPGEREDNPGGNFQITVTRVIRYPGGREVKQPVTTKYANEVTEDAPQE